MGKTNFTVKALERLAPREKRYNIFDLHTSGLGLAVYPSGAKSFFHLKKVQGWPERTTLGVFPEMSIESARGKAAGLNKELSNWKTNDFEGPHPLRRPKDVLTLEKLLTDYCERRLPKSEKCKNPAAAAEDAKWQFNKYLTSWRARKLSHIRRTDVINLHLDLKEESGPYTANRVLQLLRALFNWAIDPDSELWSGVNPAAKIALFAEEKRKRFLNGEELACLFTALRRDTNVDLQDFVVLALFTGARRSDVLSMQWSDLSLPDNRWTVPNPKSGTPYVVPLAAEAVRVLKQRLARRKDGVSWVFPSFGKSGHVVELKRAWKLLLKRAKIEDLHIHDLRRTMGSWQAALGTSLPIIGKSLGHASTAATEIYARLDLGPVRESVNAAAKAMIAASRKKPKELSTVVPHEA